MTEIPINLKMIVTGKLNTVVQELDKHATDMDYFLKEKKENFREETHKYYKQSQQEYRDAANYIRGLAKNIWRET